MTPTLRRGGALSFLLHAAVLFAVVMTLRPRLPPEPDAEETAVTVQFESAPTPGQRAPAPAPTPVSPVPAPAPPTPEPPSPPPPAPPPPPSPPVPAPPAPTLPPPRPPVPALPPPPLFVPTAPEQTAPAPLPAPPIPPPPAPRPPAPLVPTPPAPPARPAPQVPTPPTPAQPNPARPPAPDSKSLDSALDRLRAQQAGKEPPRAASPPRASPPASGSPSGIDNALLSGEVRRAIGERLRECWTGDKSALDYDKQSVRLVVTTDPTGTIRDAEVAANDASRTGGGVSRAFAERARRAALDPQCAQLPLPGALKGQNRTFEITFRP